MNRIDESEGASLFGETACDYDIIRPGYPKKFFDELQETGVLVPGATVLDVGAGNGLATKELMRRGAVVTANEPDVRFRGLLEDLGSIDVVSASFEDADLEDASYDLIVIATAFHWLDPASRVAGKWNVSGNLSTAEYFNWQIILRRNGPLH